MWKNIVAFFTMIFQFIAGLFGFSPSPTPEPVQPSQPPDSAYVESFISSETDYLLSLVLDNGAVCMTKPIYDYTLTDKILPDIGSVDADIYTKWDSAVVNPYFAATAVEGLIIAAPDKSKQAAKKFIKWYFSSMNTASTDYNGLDGTIYDYRVFINPENPSEILQISQRELHASEFDQGETNSYGYDSTDSYAALFLCVLEAYAGTYNELRLLEEHKSDIKRVYNALLSTYCENIELTAAKPDYAMCYLMDNCEVYAGLCCAADLFTKLGEDTVSADANGKAASVARGIETVLYNDRTEHYHAAAGINGKTALEASDAALNRFYPEGAAQLFPIIFGVIDAKSTRAEELYADFCERYVGTENDWSELKLGGFPWSVLLRACSIMQDYNTFETYLDALKTKYLDDGHKYPYYNAEAGSVLLALSHISY